MTTSVTTTTTKRTSLCLTVVFAATCLTACSSDKLEDAAGDLLDAVDVSDDSSGTDTGDASDTTEPEVCFNAVDDDGDGATDCDDTDCATDPDCAAAETECDDTEDNDGDGDVDCADADCAAECGETCDAAELVDEAESTTSGDSAYTGSCGGDTAPEALFTFTADSAGAWTFSTLGSAVDTVLYVLDGECDGEELGCNDDIALSEFCDPASEDDFDGDGDIGCDDADCAGSSGCIESPAELCIDEEDNDADTLVDCDDPDCALDFMCQVQYSAYESRVTVDLVAGQTVTVVVDGYDDAEAGEVYVFVATDVTESELGACDDGFDDDVDGGFDCGDPDCAGDPVCVPATCPGEDLGQALGEAVATGDTTGGVSFHYGSCGGDSFYGYLYGGRQAPDATYGWTAPADGTYVFSTAGSALDTVLYLRDGGCDGLELACGDDVEGAAEDDFSSEVTATLTAGQAVTIVVDGAYYDEGAWTLSITAAE